MLRQPTTSNTRQRCVVQKPCPIPLIVCSTLGCSISLEDAIQEPDLGDSILIPSNAAVATSETASARRNPRQWRCYQHNANKKCQIIIANNSGIRDSGIRRVVSTLRQIVIERHVVPHGARPLLVTIAVLHILQLVASALPGFVVPLLPHIRWSTVPRRHLCGCRGSPRIGTNYAAP